MQLIQYASRTWIVPQTRRVNLEEPNVQKISVVGILKSEHVGALDEYVDTAEPPIMRYTITALEYGSIQYQLG